MKCVLEWLEKSAALYPDKKAVIDPQNTLTFLALHHDAQVYGSFFARHTPVRKPIALYLEKSVQTWAAMLGGVYAGCFYSILDTRQPDIRLQNMLEILSPSFLVTDRVHQKTALRIAETGQWDTVSVILTHILLAEEGIDENNQNHHRGFR